MSNFTSILKDEIRRLAKKEIKEQTSALKSASTRYRSEIAALKRSTRELAQKVARLEKNVQRNVGSEAVEDTGVQVRFAPEWVRNHREKVGFSQAEYGDLVGVSGATIHHWENGNSRPRAKQLAAWGAIKKLGKREATARLEEL